MSKKQQSKPMNIVPMYQGPLANVMDRLFDGRFLLSNAMGAWGQLGAVDLSQTDTKVIARMALPGADPANIQVSVTANTITISGEVKQEYRSEKEQPNIEEIAYGKFQRSFSLPAKVDPESASASYENGILTVTLPKSISANARTIPVSKPSAQDGQGKQPGGTIEQETVPVKSASPA
jgi:HSP20 family molecular chaperone IbpA